MSELNALLPQPAELAAILRMNPSDALEPILRQALINPIESFLARSGKRFRSQVLEFAFAVADEGRTSPEIAKELCAKGSFIVEAIHAASMVVDDIEDQSLERRGQPTLHRQVGIPIALNAGNWLYFWPLERVKTWGFTPAQELQIYRTVIEAVVNAHFGQAIDVGVPIDTVGQEKVWETCLASLELKTGALMGLASALGAVLASANSDTVSLLRDFGISFGVALQMFDDIGNLSAKGGAFDPKQFEDLKLRRPSWVWAVAASYSAPEEFEAFKEAVRALPQTTDLDHWMERHALKVRAKSLAIEHLDRAFSPLEERLGCDEKTRWIREVGQKLRRAYE
jgi:geranylgeranyl pyrophosphate synthase